ncbi:DUF6444 domain-containing protein [Leptolyngbya sp. FACHB-1624]|uniref:DUF6444 domain-containing protein n=1 Tax=Leptolyngbya sp. FACHB-1624 TaxID=2692802 RepID=UPI0039E8982C
MKELPPLDGLSDAEKDALIQGLWQELQALRAEVEKLKQKRVKKTSRNSSLPPSKGFKPNQSRAESAFPDASATGRHHSGGRELSQQPDQVVVAQAKRCPHCGVEVELSTQRMSGMSPVNYIGTFRASIFSSFLLQNSTSNQWNQVVFASKLKVRCR